MADVPLCDAPDAPTGLAVGCAVCCGLFSGCAADPVEAAAGDEAPFCDAVWLAVAAAAPIAPPAAAAAIVTTVPLVGVAAAWLALAGVDAILAACCVGCAAVPAKDDAEAAAPPEDTVWPGVTDDWLDVPVIPLALGCTAFCGLLSGCAAVPAKDAAGAEAPPCAAVWPAAAAPIAPPAAAAVIVAAAPLVDAAWLVIGDAVPLDDAA